MRKLLGLALCAALTLPAVPAAAEERAPAEFVALGDVEPTIQQQIRYATPHNFTGGRVTGYDAPLCLLTAPAALALHRAQTALRARGYSLKVYDCYRPQRAVNRFAAWARDPAATAMKGEFYPRVEKSRLFADGYIAERSGHSRGGTVDLTIVRNPASPERAYRPGERLEPCFAPKARRFPDDSVDMGTGFDCFDPLAHTRDPRVHGAPLANRTLLKNTLNRVGFAGIADEWWHFTYQKEPFPHTYFDFPVSRRSLARTNTAAKEVH